MHLAKWDSCPRHFEATLAVSINLQGSSKKVLDIDSDTSLQFLAEGFGEIFQVNEKIFVRWDICAICSAAAHFVDVRCVFLELLLLSGAVAYFVDARLLLLLRLQAELVLLSAELIAG